MDNKKLLFIILIFIIFAANLYIGYLDYKNVYNLASAVFGRIGKEIYAGSVISKIKLMFIIFLRNLSVAGFLVISGPIYALPTFVILSVNGYLIGGVYRYSLLERGFMKTIALLLPHGIVEVPTFFYAAYLSIEIAISSVRHNESFINIYKKNLKYIITRIAPLLAIAAFIESFITPIVAGLV